MYAERRSRSSLKGTLSCSMSAEVTLNHRSHTADAAGMGLSSQPRGVSWSLGCRGSVRILTRLLHSFSWGRRGWPHPSRLANSHQPSSLQMNISHLAQKGKMSGQDWGYMKGWHAWRLQLKKKKKSGLRMTWPHSCCALRYLGPLVPWLGRTPFLEKPSH